MKFLIEFSVKNRVIVNLLAIVLIGTGLLTYASMHREMFPEFSRKAVRIETRYLGASPQEVEKLITAKVEEVLSEVDGMDEMLSISHESFSEVLLRFHADTNMDRALSDVRGLLENIRNLPEEAERPNVQEVKYAWPVITISLAGDIDESMLIKMARDLKEDLRRISGVAAVRLIGDRERQIWIEVDPSRLNQHGLTLNDIRSAIAAQNQNIPGGSLKTSRGEILIRSLGEVANANDVRKVIVKSLSTGTLLTVRDLAKVKETFEEPITISRWGGEPSLNLVIVKERDGDSIRIASAVREKGKELRAKLPSTVRIGIYNDFSVIVQNRLNTLQKSGGIGLALVFIMLCIFLRFRVALMTGLGIPIAILGGIILMQIWGISLNMLSMFGLILVLGLLVDDAIVVSENVYRYVESGMDPHEAAIRGTTEVAWPVVATIITTVAAFLPLLLVPGEMGKFLSPVPLVVTFVLIASLLEALIILPSHLADTVTISYAKRVRSEGSRLISWLRRVYGGLLKFALRKRYLVCTGLLSITLLLVAVAYYRMPFVLFKEFESSLFFINFETSPSNRIENTLEIAKKAEKIVLDLPEKELASVATNVGLTVIDVVTIERGANLAQILVELSEKRERSVDEVITDLRKGISRISGILKVQFLKTQAGPGGSDIEVQVAGEQLPVLRKLGDEVSEFLNEIRGVRDVRDDFTEGKEEIRIELRQEARALGLDLLQVARQVQNGFKGVEASSIQRRDEDVPIIVRFSENTRLQADALNNLRIALPSGEYVFLQDIAFLTTAIGTSKVRRHNQRRTITVYADVNNEQANAVNVANRLRSHFDDISRKLPGYRVIVKGERQEAQASLASLPRISVIAILLIYLVLGSLFRSFIQPLVVMAAIPFAIDGVVIGHLIMGENLTLLSIFGLVALIGIVVNDSLIMVDFINRARKNNVQRNQAILESGVARLRPILLTTVTTVGGLTPLAFFATGQALFLSPMAISIVWGLTFATILTLILIPCLYAVVDDIVQFIQKLFGRLTPNSSY